MGKISCEQLGIKDWEVGSVANKYTDKDLEEAAKTRLSLKEGTGDDALKKRESVFMKAWGGPKKKEQKEKSLSESQKAKLETVELELKESNRSGDSAGQYGEFFRSLAEKNGLPYSAGDLFRLYFEGSISHDQLMKDLIAFIE